MMTSEILEREGLAMAVHGAYAHDCTASELCRTIADHLWDLGYRYTPNPDDEYARGVADSTRGAAADPNGNAYYAVGYHGWKRHRGFDPLAA